MNEQNSYDSKSGSTFFGRKIVSILEKTDMVHDVFSKVATKYDIMNDCMSFGLHRLWKRKMVSLLSNPYAKLLDVATGSGDIIRKYYHFAKKYNVNPDITACDINEDMLNIAKEKLTNAGICGINYVVGDAQALSFDDDMFDYYTISFGIRNVTDVKSALQEAYRVLRGGQGQFICMEFVRPVCGDEDKKRKLMQKLYSIYSQLIPYVGKVVANDFNSYEYLVESIETFYSQEEFLQLMQDAGFKKTYSIDLLFGIVAIYVGYKE